MKSGVPTAFPKPPYVAGGSVPNTLLQPTADAGVVQQILPARHRVVHRLASFDSFAVFTSHDFFTVLRISSHWLRFHWRREGKIISALHIKEPRCLDPMLLLRIRQERSGEQDFVETRPCS